MSIPPNSPWRAAAAFFRQPLEPSDELAAQNLVETVYYFNARCSNLPDIEYRSSDGELDVRQHVFRWDRTPYDIVFENGFEARRQSLTPDSIFFNLERYVNSGGRPLDTRRDTTHAFISTTRSSSWTPSVNPGAVTDRVYRYEIYAPGGILVAETLGDLYQHPGQDEVAFIAGIAPQYIRSAQAFEFTSEGRFTRGSRVDTTLHRNRNFNPQSHPQRRLKLEWPISDYLDENKQRKKLETKMFPERLKREVANDDDELIEYYTEGVSDVDGYIDSAFRSSRTYEAYIFMRGEYVCINYAPGSTNDEIVSGPYFIGDSFYSLVGTAFAAYGIDAAFGCHDKNEAIIFSGNLCAKINYAPGTLGDRIIEGRKTIRKMFPFFRGTNFEKGIDAAFESTVPGQAYLFKGSQYARIDHSRQALVGAIRPIADGFQCLRDTEFETGIGAAFASHVSNEAYLFKGNTYLLLHFTPGENKDNIVGGPKEIVPTNWTSLKNILPRKNRGLDIYEFHMKDPERPQDEL